MARNQTPQQFAEANFYTTTVLASNIHCSSCHARITEALSNLDVVSVNVNLVTGEVKVVHPSLLSPDEICQKLYDESYRPHNVITMDSNQRVVYDRQFDGPQYKYSSIWFRRSEEGLHSSKAKHMENCAACRLNSIEESSSHQTANVKAKEEDEQSLRKAASTTTDGASIEEPLPVISQEQRSQRWKLTLSISGMTCSSCTSSITEAVQEMDSVDKVNVDLLTNSCVVEFTNVGGYVENIRETIEDKGYESEVTELKPLYVDDDRIQAKLSIGGMTCASCASSITKGLEQLSYVEKVSVSLLTNSAIVELSDPSNLTRVVEEVEDIGFDCSVDSWEAVTVSHGSEDASQRQADIKIEGMFCEHCPSRIIDHLRTNFGPYVSVIKPLGLRTGIMTVQYTPRPPVFTIRSIVSAINSSHEAFSAKIYHPPSIEERSKMMQKRERRHLLRRLLFSFIAAIPTFLIGIVWMELDKNSSIHKSLEQTMWGNAKRNEWALFFISTPVYLFSADVFHIRAMKEIRALWRPGSKTPLLKRFYRFGSMSLLISAGTTVAYIASLIKLIMDATGSKQESSMTYFDAVVFLTFFILAGRYLEAASKSNTGDAVSQLGKLKPDRALLADYGSVGDGSLGRNIDADMLEIGDLVIIPHGSAPPADGIVVAGEGRFDEKSLTGESRLVHKTAGAEVYTGTISAGEPVTIRVTKVGGASMLDRIVSVVREGLGTRAPVERYADSLTSYFVPVITAAAIITWIVWLTLGYSGALDKKYLHNQAGGWAFWSLNFAIAVFVTACPCGIGLAAPTALFAGIGIAAKLGILVQGGGEAFQEAPHLDAIVFDKTGTLTEGGDIKVSDHFLINVDDSEKPMIWAMIEALEEQSSHPIAKAIFELAATQTRSTLKIESVSEVAGRGLLCMFTNPETGATYEAAIGSEKHMISLDSTIMANNSMATDYLSEWQSESKSVALFATRDFSDSTSKWELKGLFATADPLRPSAGPAIDELQRRGLKVFMLSGDHTQTAKAVGASLGIPEQQIFAGVLPTEKADIIKMLQRTLFLKPTGLETGYDTDLERQAETLPDATTKNASVAFVGDGINDAPALLASSLSISMGTGAQIAMNSSQFILLSSDLMLIPTLIDLSSKVYRRIKFNFGWALVYNVILVPIAAGVLFRIRSDGFRLGPIWASLAMALSSLSVVASSMVLKLEGNIKYRNRMKK